MPQPFNYGLNLPNPVQDLLGTVQLAGGIQQLQANRAALEADQVKAERSQLLQGELAALSVNPNPQAINQAMIRFPEISEALKRAHDSIGADEQKAQIHQVSQVYSALLTGQPSVAKDLLTEIATAYRNAGREQDAKEAEFIANQVERDPNKAAASVGAYLSAAMGPGEFAETFAKVMPEKAEPGWANVSEAYRKKKGLDPGLYQIKLGGEDKGQIKKVDGSGGSAGKDRTYADMQNQLEYEATLAFLKKEATAEQKAIINQDWISKAISSLGQNPAWPYLAPEEQAKKITAFVGAIEKAQGGKKKPYFDLETGQWVNPKE